MSLQHFASSFGKHVFSSQGPTKICSHAYEKKMLQQTLNFQTTRNTPFNAQYPINAPYNINLKKTRRRI